MNCLLEIKSACTPVESIKNIPEILKTVFISVDYFFHRCTFDEHLLEFSKLTQDRIVGTKDDVAHIYDVMTGTKLMKLFDPEKTNNYYANAATFSPTDELVLNDGVLWDVRSQKLLHKFNRFISGVFHPMGQDIIINSEIWDQQTFKLLHTVPALDQCQIKFNHAGDVNFANRIEDEMETNFEELRIQFSSTLKTFNATDYSSIGTMDLKTPSIFDLCIDKSDFCLAVIEQNTQFTDGGSKKSICHLYQTGKLQDEEDDGMMMKAMMRRRMIEYRPSHSEDDDDDEEEEEEEENDNDDLDDMLFAMA
ncbi:DDB1- and CUL4-associated factor 1-like [Pomacea canaliculata]|uniref:DDB1- and CUL4-associated factor 1-like n=1 Tax=Pomacea canaliculata TaxID=400727 RepID=UPI000D72C0E0|nr:DDB1- and CUL4-associated factor 1-like [Pomacea canaliculata]